MRVDAELLEGVVFVGTEEYSPFSPVGTGFLFSYTHKDSVFFFLATAEHVISQIAGNRIAIRANRNDGGCGTFPLEKKFRIYSTQDDIAVFHIPNITARYATKFWPLDRKRRDFVHRNTYLPAVGDEVITLGLYTSHYGQSKNIPVARVGNIAMLPGEPVKTEDSDVEAYLVEVRSIAGLSGSPVFLQVPRIRFTDDGPQFLDTDITLFVGMMIGYHVVESRQDQIATPQFQGFRETSGAGSDERNTGFAVVIPEDRFLELMEMPEMSERLDQIVAEQHKRSGFRRT